MLRGVDRPGQRRGLVDGRLPRRFGRFSGARGLGSRGLEHLDPLSALGDRGASELGLLLGGRGFEGGALELTRCTGELSLQPLDGASRLVQGLGLIGQPRLHLEDAGLLGVELVSRGFDGCRRRLELGPERAGLRQPLFGLRLCRFGVRLGRFGVRLGRFGVRLGRFGVRLRCLGVRLRCLGLRLRCLGLRLGRFGLRPRALGRRGCGGLSLFGLGGPCARSLEFTPEGAGLGPCRGELLAQLGGLARRLFGLGSCVLGVGHRGIGGGPHLHGLGPCGLDLHLETLLLRLGRVRRAPSLLRRLGGMLGFPGGFGAGGLELVGELTRQRVSAAGVGVRLA